MIGKILKTMRRKTNLSQEQIGLLIGYAKNTISQYENGTRNPDFATIEKIANECGYEIYFYNKKTDDKLTTQNIDRKEIWLFDKNSHMGVFIKLNNTIRSKQSHLVY